MPVLLELFSGTGSIGRAFEAQGWEVISLDIDPRSNATFCCDVLQWDYSCLEAVDCIWASPPCTMYSTARTTGRSADLEFADSLVRKTLEIAAAFGNPPLFVENPWTGKLRHRGLLDDLHMLTVDYCKYGMPYRKRTAIWTNTNWIPDQALCNHDCPSSVDGRRHLAIAQRGPPGGRFTQRELYRIPDKLCEAIAAYCTHEHN